VITRHRHVGPVAVPAPLLDMGLSRCHWRNFMSLSAKKWRYLYFAKVDTQWGGELDA
jgi:hypothetical protein